MKAVFLRSCLIGLAATLGACTTGPLAPASGGVDVTRFHLSQPFARSQIAVEAADAADRNSPGFPFYRYAVEAQLKRLGWTIVPTSGQSEQIAMIDVEQGSRAALSQRATIGGGATIGAGRGTADLVTTLLEVSIRRRSDASVFWEGRADAEARGGSAGADPKQIVPRLAEALFQDFPGESGRTISIR